MLLFAAGLYAIGLNFCKFIVAGREVTEAGVQRRW
jgi:hypothetical protein